MPSGNRLLLWLLGILLLAGVGWYSVWFLTNFEPYTEEIKTGLSPEARKNPFLAAEYFLDANAQPVQSHASRDIFKLDPAQHDTIFLGNHSQLFLERNSDALTDWVAAGGNLVLRAESSADDEEAVPLLSELGVELRYNGFDCEGLADNCEQENSAEPDASDADQQDSRNSDAAQEAESEPAPGQDDRVKVTFQTDHPGEFTARFLSDSYLLDSKGLANAVVDYQGQAKLLRYSYGSGSVTVLSDTELFQNHAIGELDHAYLFANLVSTPGKVWIFYSANMPSLLTLLWQRTPYLLLTVLFLLLMAGWSLLLRSGPQLTPKYGLRRNLLEHLQASAEYSWRIDRARQLFVDNRDAIEHTWRRRHPHLNLLEEEERCQWIGEKTGIAAGAIKRTLYERITSEQDFIRASAVLQQLATQINHKNAYAQ